MGFNQVAGAFEGYPSAVSHTVRVPETGATKQVVSVFARLGPDGSGQRALGHCSFSVTGGAFTSDSGGWTNLGGDFRTDPVAAQQYGGAPSPGAPAHRVYLRGLDNSLWVTWSNGTSWFGPERVGGEFTSDLSVVDSPRGIHVFVRGLDQQLWAFYYGATSRSIAQMDLAALGGAFDGNPQAVTGSDGRIHVFVRGLDDALWRNWSDASGWRGFASLSGVPGLSNWDPVPVLVRRESGGPTPGAIFVFAVNPSGSEVNYCRLREDDSHVWGPARPDEMGGPLGSLPVGVCHAPGVIDVFTRSPAGSLWHSGQTLSAAAETGFPNWDELVDMGAGRFPGRPCVVAAAGTIHVFVRGADNLLWHTWWNGRSWS
jgi:hypothetical protein